MENSDFAVLQKTAEDILFTKNEVRYALLPLWFMNTRYKDKSYTFVINGQTGKMSGSLPISWIKFFLWLGGFTALIGGLCLLVALFLL